MLQQTLRNDTYPLTPFSHLTTVNRVMKIAHVAPVIYTVPPRTYGGTERVIADLIAEQMAAGHDVTLYGCATSTAGCDIRGGILCLDEHIRRGTFGDETLPPGFPAVLEARLIAALVRDQNRYDIIHLHGGFQVSGALAASDTPTVRTIHWRTDEADHRHFFELFPREQVVAISHSQAQAIPAANLASVVHHGIDLSLYRPRYEAGDYLVFIGRMTDQKGPDRAIDIARLVSMPLRLAGNIDPGNPGYFSKKVEPRLDDNIRFIDSVDAVQKNALLRGARALLFPIDWPEPFGLVMVEAMACGTPIIAAAHGSTREIVEPGVTGFIYEDVSQIPDMIGRASLLDRRKIRQQCDARFARGIMAAQYEKVYEQLVSAKRRA